jgi:hypothetical protein
MCDNTEREREREGEERGEGEGKLSAIFLFKRCVCVWNIVFHEYSSVPEEEKEEEEGEDGEDGDVDSL